MNVCTSYHEYVQDSEICFLGIVTECTSNVYRSLPLICTGVYQEYLHEFTLMCTEVYQECLQELTWCVQQDSTRNTYRCLFVCMWRGVSKVVYKIRPRICMYSYLQGMFPAVTRIWTRSVRIVCRTYQEGVQEWPGLCVPSYQECIQVLLRMYLQDWSGMCTR
jgi:hypothetical protein